MFLLPIFNPTRPFWIGYYFASAILEDVYLTLDPTVRFTFYLDPLEPLNSEDPTRNVNPEVVPWLQRFPGFLWGEGVHHKNLVTWENQP